MKKIVVISSILLPLFVAGTAQTVEKPTSTKPFYVSFKIGGSIPRDNKDDGDTISFDKGVHGSAAFGLRLQPTVRLELEGSYRKVDFDQMTISGTTLSPQGDTTVKALMANAYYDFPMDSPLKPYVVGGIGRARRDMDMTALGIRVRGHETGGAYQFGGGLSYVLSEVVTADVGYRYLGLRQDGDDSGFHEFLAGLRFGF